MQENTFGVAMKVEWIILADAAECINNKMYVLGGGWTDCQVQGLPTMQPIALVVSFLVEWNETNIKHDALVECVDADGAVMWSGNYVFTIGRPYNLESGSPQRVQTVWIMMLQFQTLGAYAIHVRCEEESERTIFRVGAV